MGAFTTQVEEKYVELQKTPDPKESFATAAEILDSPVDPDELRDNINSIMTGKNNLVNFSLIEQKIVHGPNWSATQNDYSPFTTASKSNQPTQDTSNFLSPSVMHIQSGGRNDSAVDLFENNLNMLQAYN